MKRATLSLIASTVCALTLACGANGNADVSTSSTDTMSRNDAINDMADAACNRADECGNIGSNQKWDTKTACINDQTQVFSKRWSMGSCGDPHGVVEGKFADCQNRVKQYACSGNIFDLGGVLTECGEGDVCR